MLQLPLCSRSGHTSPFGKLAAMPTVRLGGATIDGLRRLAAAAGVPYGEFVRVTLEARVHGLKHVQSVAAQQIELIAGAGVATDAASDPTIQ